ncbi:MaoC family dehydratase [Fodinicurvata sediminis]|uniref:MaoC family dehydratase n=1 Tax=Fodinicurvata sediminis TaxID=1121832 RepID=UPI0003B73EA6|nr:MaoC family dehydratase [Fodinicurvata sediminis]
MQGSRGYCLEDLETGMVERFSKTVTEADIVLYAGITGDTNPLHLDQDYAETTMFKGRIAHGMLTAGFVSAVLGTRLPGPGAVYVDQSLSFKRPVRIGDTVTAEVTVKSIDSASRRVVFNTVCLVNDKSVLEGEATLMVASRAQETAAAE